MWTLYLKVEGVCLDDADGFREQKIRYGICVILVRIFWVLENCVGPLNEASSFPGTHEINSEYEATKVLLLDGIKNSVFL